MKAIKVRADGTIQLPPDILQRFPRASELGVSVRGDAIILKRLQPASPSSIAERAPEDDMPLDEISAEVHRMRQEKRRPRG